MADIDIGNAYVSLTKGDVTLDSYLTFTPTFPLLPAEIAPLHKQLRIFIDREEMQYVTGRELSPPTTNLYTYTAEAPTAGVRCWGVRYTADAISESGTENQSTAHITIYDQDDNQIVWDETWTFSDEQTRSMTVGDSVTDGPFDDNVFNTVPTQGHEDIPDPQTWAVTNFPRAFALNRIGWCRAYNDASDHSWENVKVEVNVGTPLFPAWITFGDNTLHEVQTRAGSAHTAGDELVLGNYPALQNPIVAGTDDVYFDWTLIHTTPRDLNTPVPIITVTKALDGSTERAMIMRETRQDRPWFKPTRGARAHSYGLWWYFEQIRYIVQELCELEAIASFVGLPPSGIERNDYTGGSQSVTHVATLDDTFSFEDIELLDWAPGASAYQNQLIVEKSSSGVTWETVAYLDPPTDADEYNIVGTDVVLGGAITSNVRIRRNTRTDQYWVDMLTGDLAKSGWNSAFVDLLQRQARFMIEEACILPTFFNGELLRTSIFPRGWNWLTYVGTLNQWTIPGGVWGGGGEVLIFRNNVLLVEGVDYTLEWPQIIWTVPPDDDDETTIGYGTGGWGGGGLGGGEDTEEIPPSPVITPTEEIPPIDWPGNSVPAGAKVSVSIGSTAEADLSSGNWEGGTNVSFSQGNATVEAQFGSSPMRIEVTVLLADSVSDGAGGFLPPGAVDVWYVNKICSPTTSDILYRVASAWKADPNDAWSSDEASPSLGCLAPDGADPGNNLWAEAAEVVSSTSPATWRLLDSLANITGAIAQGDITQVPYMRNYLELLENADAFAASQGGNTGFTGDQFDDWIDPDTDMTDFDIPDP